MQSTDIENSSVGVSPSAWGIKPWEGKMTRFIKSAGPEGCEAVGKAVTKCWKVILKPTEKLPPRHGRSVE